MLNRVVKKSTTETIISIVFVVLFLFVILSPHFQFTDKLIFGSECIVLYCLIKQCILHGILHSLQDSLSSMKRITFVLLVIIFEFLFVFLFYEKCGSYTLMRSIFIKCSMVGFTGIITSYMYYVVWQLDISRTFKILCFSLGMVFMTVLPVGVVPDEGMHSFTAYRISNIFLGIENKKDEITMRKTDGGSWLVSEFNYYTNENYEAYFDTLNFGEVDTTLGSYAIPYTVGNDYLYILPTFGILIGRVLTLNTFQIYFLGRIFNFLLYLFGMTYVIHKAPFKKMVFVVLSLLPVFLQQGISSSYDVPINVMTLIILVQTLSIFGKEKQELQKFDWIILIISCFIMCFVKSHAYILVGLMPLLCLGVKKIQESKYHKQIWIGLGIFMVGCVVGVFVVASMLPTVVLSDSDSYSILYLLQNPKELFAIAYNTVLTFDTYYIDTFIGKYLGYLDIGLPSCLIYLYYAILLVLMIPKEEDRNQLTVCMKVVFVFVSGMTAAFALAGMLLANSTVGDRMVLGMQGRYLLASIALLFFIIEPKFISASKKNDTHLFGIFLMIEFLAIGILMLVL